MNIPPGTLSLFDYERHFHRLVPEQIRAYISGAAADGITQQENRAAFDRLKLLPRALADLSGASAASSIFGDELAYPIIIAPTAFHRLVHPEGEMETVRAAGLTRTWMTVSTHASISLEEIASAASGPLWFQLYFQPRRDDTLALVRRAEQAGYRAIVVTVDAVISGIRNVEQRAGFALPAGISAVNLKDIAPASVLESSPGSPILAHMLAHAPRWDDLAWLCGQTALPVLVKGMVNWRDVEPALAAGAKGIIVSNHGGRVLDTVPATIDVLPDIARAVAGRAPVLLDGGVRRGTDIIKAVALGASAVLIGQPILHALAVGGVAGVAHLLTLLQTELEAAMALTGHARLHQICRKVLAFP